MSQSLSSISPDPVVSIVIPAYKVKYLEFSLLSIMEQDFKDYEIIICDDSPDGEVGDFIEKFQTGHSVSALHYYRNESRLWENGNLSRCIEISRGRYIKPLYDDDILLSGCLAKFVDIMERHPDASLISSRRELIDENGNRLPDTLATMALFDEDTCLHGRDLVSFLGEVTVNFIGEPSSVMFRREHILPETGRLFHLGDQAIPWVGDLTMLVKLLRKGNLLMLRDAYSGFRVSKEQYSQVGRDSPGVGEQGHENFRRMIRELQWGRTENIYDVRIRPLNDSTKGFAPLNLQARIEERFNLLRQQDSAAYWGVPQWLEERAPSPARILAVQTMLQANPDVGTLGVAVIVPNGADVALLEATLDSLETQHRPVHGIWLVGGTDVSELNMPGAESVTGTEPWPTLLSQRIEQGDMPDFLWILHAGDQLLPQATLTMGEYRLRDPNPLVWYADEANLEAGLSANPMLKPDFNIDLLRSYPYVGRSLVLSTVAIQAMGGLDGRVTDLSLIDLLWRMVEQAGPPVVGHVPEVLLHSAQSLLDWASEAQTQVWFPAVTQAHFVRLGLDAQVLPGTAPGLFRTEYPLPGQPLVSIIVPTRDHFFILRDCIEGLMDKTGYPNYELLIVDNGSAESDAVMFLKKLEDMAMDRVRVLRWPQAFDFAAMNNFAVEQAKGEVLLFLNNDVQFTEQTRADWLERLLRHAVRPEVGMVGSRLDLPDGRVDQVGQVLGLDNSVGSGFHGVASDRLGYMRRMVVQQNTSALSASCLMMRREVFLELGGFDAEAFPVYYADTDLSLKAVKAGYLLTLEPETGLLHMGGATRLLTEKFGLVARPDDEQRDRLYARWLPQLARDPFYHPAYGKFSPGFDLSVDAARIHQPLPGRPLPVVLVSHADWHGCGHYRILHPFKAMTDELRAEGGVKLHDFHFTDVARIEPEVIVLQGAWAHHGILTQIRRYREITGAKVVLEFDDYLPNIPTRSIHRKIVSQGMVKHMRRAIEQCDWLVVSTSVLADEYAKYHHDIRVANNGLLPSWWRDLKSLRGTGRKPRVGWAGGGSHTGDLAEIRYVVKELENEVEWVFMGMQPEGVKCEFHPGVPIKDYPEKLASLNLDLAVVPLEINQFNRCKSNLRLLELGACGVPAICTDIEAYQGDLPVTRVGNRHQDWVEAIRSHLADRQALGQAGDALKEAVSRDWMLEGQFLDQWARAWGTAAGK